MIKKIPWQCNIEGFYTVRTTELESFMMCGLKYEKDVFEKTAERMDVFMVGKLWHNVLEARMMKQEIWEDEEMTLEEREWMEYLRGIKLPEYEKIVVEKTYGVLFGDVLYLEGTLDVIGVISEERKEVEILDFKTANSFSMWEEEEYQASRKQAVVYPWLFRQYNPSWEVKAFKYYVFLKKSKPELRVYEFNYTKEEVEKDVKEMIRKYLEYKKTGVPPKQEGPWCRWCKLRDVCKKGEEAVV